MIRTAAHLSSTAAQIAINVNALVDCYRCGGYPDVDETGRAYTCYCCCDTGFVTLAQQYEEYASGVVYAVANPRPAPYRSDDYDCADDWDAHVVRLPNGIAIACPSTPAVDFDDDIPF